MNHRERVLSALQRKGYDRLPVRHLGEPPVNRTLMEHFGMTAGTGVDHVANIGQRLAEEELDLLQRIGDDLRYVQPRYCGPAPRTFPDGSRELAYPDRGWPVPTRYKDVSYGQGVYTEAVWRPFESVSSVQELDAFEFPTADWLDYSNLKQDCERWDEYAIVTGTPGVLDFINGISHSRGLERLFIDIGTEDPVYLKLMEKLIGKLKFYPIN